MFGNFPPTPYDLRFEVLRIPVRVHPIFWLSSAWLAWAPGRLDITGIRVLCIFFAVFVHEMGHALVTRRFGWQPEIVLHMLGGYATSMRHSTWKDIAVSAAGPGAGFLFLVAIWLPALHFGWVVPEQSLVHLESWELATLQGAKVGELMHYVIDFSLFANSVINMINLVPVLPLDGGQISREYWLWAKPRDGMQICLKLGVAAGGAIAAWSLYSITSDAAVWTVGRVLGLDDMFLGIMFGYLAYMSYEQMQNSRGSRW